MIKWYCMLLPDYIDAMVLESTKARLVYKKIKMPVVLPGQVLLKVNACGICRTDLHIIDGDLSNPKLPLIPGHEIIGTVVGTGKEVKYLQCGDLAGVHWLGYTCGTCKFCISGRENLCEHAGFTGYTIDGGFAAYTVANEQYCFPLSARYADAAAAPLLCAGLIGYRSYSMVSSTAVTIGIYGFGAAAHILTQVAVSQGKKIFAFTRDNDSATQAFALKLGACWAGGSSQSPAQKLDAAIIFAPDGGLIQKALQDVDKGCTVVCGGIHMSDIPSFAYDILWGEKIVRSVANLTRDDVTAFFKIAADTGIQTSIKKYPLYLANEALDDVRNGRIKGAAVLVMS